MLSLALNGKSDQIFDLREKIVDIFSAKIIPTYKYYAEAFFAVYSKSKPDLDFFFKSNILDFFNLVMSTICLANSKTMFPEQKATMGISEYDLEDLFKIAYRHVGWFDFEKKKHLKKIKELFNPLIKETLPLAPDKLPFQTEREVLTVAISNEMKTMNLEDLKKINNFMKKTANKESDVAINSCDQMTKL